MAENCTHDCSSCGENCSSRTQEQTNTAPQKEQPNALTQVKHVIGVVSGKGGVGKSMITALAACEMAKRGFRVGIMDADLTGPSIPRMFGIGGKAYGTEDGIIPRTADCGIEVMSLNLLLETESDPVVWRGPVIAGVVRQFWTDVIWGDLDYLFVDMPPGTGDVPLTVFQSLPVEGILVVSSPQELVEMIVEKAAKMAEMMDIPVLGLIENMSYITCPDCGKKICLFGESKAKEVAEKHGISTYVSLPIVPLAAASCDRGEADQISFPEFSPIGDCLAAL